MLNLNNKKYIKLVAVIVLLIFLHFIKVLNPVEDFVVKIFNPVLSSFHSAATHVRITYKNQTDKRDLALLVAQLEKVVTDLITENAHLKSLEEENQVLREYLKFSKENEQSFVLGNIVARKGLETIDLDKNLIIDKGTDDGVKNGSAVISKNTIIGKVVGVKNNLAEICLITNRDCKLAASIQNKDKTSGIIKGELGLTVNMEFIPQTEEVNVGDIVVTSNLEDNIPGQLVIGKISEVKKESNELWQSAIIEPLVDMDDLVIVSVLIL